MAGLHGRKDRSGNPIFLLDPATAQADPDGAVRYGLPHAPQNGYVFRMLKTDPDGEPYQKEADKEGRKSTHKSRFGVSACPVPYAKGRPTFLLNEEGTIYKKDTGGAPVEAWPGKDPVPEGWRPVE